MTLMVEGSGGSSGGFSVAIGTGSHAKGNATSHTFGTITPTITGGTSPFTRLWMETDDGLAIWTGNGATTTTLTPAVNAVPAGNITQASYVLQLTDSSTPPKIITSNTASYSFFNNNPV